MNRWRIIFRAIMVVILFIVILIVNSRLRHNVANGDPNIRLTASESRSISNSAFLIVAVPGILISFVIDKILIKVTSDDKRNNNRSHDKKIQSEKEEDESAYINGHLLWLWRTRY